MRAWVSVVFFAAGFAASACSSYTSALGFRARRAVMENNVEQFRDLMDEAAYAEPKGPYDNPKKTVLTHFLDLAADSRFFPYIEEWQKRGWVADDMVCSIHRARYRAVKDADPESAQRSVDVAIETARAAAKDPDKSWQVKDCIEEAAFLTETATASLVQFVRIVADPTEPLKLRVSLLEGMSRIPVSGPERRLDNDSSLTREQAVAQAEAQLRTVQRRFEWIVAAARPFTDIPLLASGTAYGAMEIEEASLALGRSYVGLYAAGEHPDDNDLAWAWVRVMKTKKKVPSLQTLGIWNKEKEPRDDVYWYVCSRTASPPAPGSPAAALGPINTIEAITIRTSTKGMDRDALRTAQCTDQPSGATYPAIIGPFPLESIGRGMAASAHQPIQEQKSSARTSVLLRRRVLL